MSRKAKSKHCEGDRESLGDLHTGVSTVLIPHIQLAPGSSKILLISYKLNHTEFILSGTWPETRFIKLYIALSSRLTPHSKGH